ncbi:hypothetical protein GCM10010507_43860 [Streptomyces cinnamoneus]|uniref:SH3 domain-containing protein n=1 Tax=Streptomyces cinnamoneus TaxID=53446 RepID=A0A918TT77_STRCJ|nr:hypothetical protein GCM10010507_43860 [Streptomyces cinnamoneus]
MDRPDTTRHQWQVPAGSDRGSKGEPFAATHVVPATGLDSWRTPDAMKAPDGRLDPGTRVQVVERSPSGWARVVCASGGWPVWVDGRRLQEPTESEQAIGMELLSQLKTSLGTYQQLLDDLQAQRIDFDSFRRQAFHAGLVMRDSGALLLDLPSGTWYWYDGIRLHTMGSFLDEEPPPDRAAGSAEG